MTPKDIRQAVRMARQALMERCSDQELQSLSPSPSSYTGPIIPKLHPRQHEFLGLDCEEALYGGAAGGGKTHALLVWLAEGIHVRGYSGIFFRRTYAQLSKSTDSPITTSHELYRPLGGTYKSGEHRWTFPSGAPT